MATKTANDLIGEIGELAERLTTTAQTQIRHEIADGLADLIKGRDLARITDNLAAYLTTEDGRKPYVPHVDVDTWQPTTDFLAGMRFAIAALRDKTFEY